MLQFRVLGGGGGGGGHCKIVTRNCPDYCGCLYSPAMLQVAVYISRGANKKI